MAEHESALPWEGQPYSVKRHGVTITNCDSEPVQTPGCIQSHGALLVLRPTDLVVVQASENTERWLGRAPHVLLGASVSEALGEASAGAIEAVLRRGSPDVNPTYAFSVSAREGRPPLDAIVHVNEGVVIVELEEYRRASEALQRDPYSPVKSAVARLQQALSLEEFQNVTCEEIKRFTDFDRVMIYRFHDDLHGEVVAEAKSPELSPLLGLHYPAEDIPLPAREVFTKTWIRPVADVDGELIELLPLTNPDTGRPLNMTQCALRGPSIMYTEYLRNMGVRSALTMSLRRGDTLWGLIACHGYQRPTYLPLQVREACELLAQVVSLQHQAAEERELIRRRQVLDGVRAALVQRALSSRSLVALNQDSPTLLEALSATGAAVYDSGQWAVVGTVPPREQLDELREWREQSPEDEGVFATDELPRVHPPSRQLAAVASGLLSVRVSRSHSGLLLWFRPEKRREIRWAGDPSDKPSAHGPHGPRLTPRRSFELFLESVTERAEPWTSPELDAARRLRRDLLELVLSQMELLAKANDELRQANRELARSNEELDAFAYVASHDLKEPLRGINKYAHQLLAVLPPEQEGLRTKAESVMRLTLRMDTLIESLLRFSRVGRISLDLVDVQLGEVVQEAIEMLDVRRAEGAVEIVIPRPLPRVLGDRVQLREVFCNLLSNAMKYNDKVQRRVEIGYLAPGEPGDRGTPPESAAGSLVVFVRDNGIGISPAHQAVVFELFRRLHGRDAYGGGIGAGLTIVKKLLERHGGEVWLSSEPGVGSTFYFNLGAH